MTPKGNPFLQPAPPDPLPQPLAATSERAFSSLQICLFWAAPVNGVTQHVAFCDWFPSLGLMFLDVHFLIDTKTQFGT